MRAYMKWVDSYLRMVINDNILCRVLLWDHAFMYDEVVGMFLNSCTLCLVMLYAP